MNRQNLHFDSGDRMPELRGSGVAAGAIELASATITFLAMPRVKNAICR